MDEVVAALAAQQTQLRELVAAFGPAEWAAPSPCEGWSASDVLLHLAQTNEMAIGSIDGRMGEVLGGLTAGLAPTADIDEGAGAMVEAQRVAGPDAILRRYLDSADTLRARVRAADLHDRVQWVAGLLSVRTLATTRLAETWIHTGDIADAVGVTLAPSDRLRYVARLAWRTIPYAFERAGRALAGPVAFALTGPDDQPWDFVPDEPAVTVIRGPGVDLCRVAGRRVDAVDTALIGEGPDAAAVLELVRTYA